MFGSVADGVATVLFALTPNFVLATLALGVVGAADLVSVVIRQSVVQLCRPDELRGRVFAVNSMFTATSNQLGTFRAGTAAALLGTVPAVLLGGLGTIAVMLVGAAVFRGLFRSDSYEPAQV